MHYPGDQWPNNERDESEYNPAEPQGKIGPLGEQEKHMRWLVDNALMRAEARWRQIYTAGPIDTDLYFPEYQPKENEDV